MLLIHVFLKIFLFRDMTRWNPWRTLHIKRKAKRLIK